MFMLWTRKGGGNSSQMKVSLDLIMFNYGSSWECNVQAFTHLGLSLPSLKDLNILISYILQRCACSPLWLKIDGAVFFGRTFSLEVEKFNGAFG